MGYGNKQKPISPKGRWARGATFSRPARTNREKVEAQARGDRRRQQESTIRKPEPPRQFEGAVYARSSSSEESAFVLRRLRWRYRNQGPRATATRGQRWRRLFGFRPGRGARDSGTSERRTGVRRAPTSGKSAVLTLRICARSNRICTEGFRAPRSSFQKVAVGDASGGDVLLGQSGPPPGAPDVPAEFFQELAEVHPGSFAGLAQR
jgi:hypothetical protein